MGYSVTVRVRVRRERSVAGRGFVRERKCTLINTPGSIDSPAGFRRGKYGVAVCTHVLTICKESDAGTPLVFSAIAIVDMGDR